jgi:murein DD-endopeptidase MepM/ murein hydrolase activator NlpD
VAAGAVVVGTAVTPAAVSWLGQPGQPPAPAAALRPLSVNNRHSAVASTAVGSTYQLGRYIAAVRQQAQHAAIERASRRHRRKHHATVRVVYDNPLRDISGLMPQRVDMGVDFAGSGPVYAIGDGVVTAATGTSGGWPGGGWIT